MPPDDNSVIQVFRRAIAAVPSAASVPPRALLVFAHPDDETLAMGARLANFTGAHLVHVTDGAPRNEQDSRHHGFATLADYRKARAFELTSVLAAAGLAQISRECLRVPDQEASYHLALLTRVICRIVGQHRPEVIVTHPYEGGHPDHDACAFAVHHALDQLHAGARPVIIESAFYHASVRGQQAGTFLPTSQPVPQAEIALTPEEIRRKQNLLALFVSQAATLRTFPLAVERFRIAPSYDFRKAPHTPPLLYDMHPWGMTSEQFVQLARNAEESLSKPLPAVCR